MRTGVMRINMCVGRKVEGKLIQTWEKERSTDKEMCGEERNSP